MGYFISRMIGICYLASRVIVPVMAAGNETNGSKITSLWGIIGNPVDAFNGLDSGTRGILQWALALLVLASVVAVIFGTSKNTIQTSIGSKTKDAKLTTGGIEGNIMIVVTVIVGIIALGVSIALLSGLGK